MGDDVQAWRVVDDAGVTREVAVCVAGGVWAATFPAEPSWPQELGTNARGAVLRVCALCRVDAVEVRGPGEETTAEQVGLLRLEARGWQDQCESTTDDAGDQLIALDAEVTRLRDVAHDVVWHAMLHHPLPWRVERDWTHEVTAADGTIVAKCMTHERAAAIIATAERIAATLAAHSGEDAAQVTP